MHIIYCSSSLTQRREVDAQTLYSIPGYTDHSGFTPVSSRIGYKPPFALAGPSGRQPNILQPIACDPLYANLAIPIALRNMLLATHCSRKCS